MSVQMLLQGLISGLLLGFIYALISMGLSLIFGIMGVVNFAYGEFLMLGMYASYWLNLLWGLDPIFSIPISGVIMALLGIITHKLAIKRILGKPRPVLTLTTFGISILLSSLAQLLFTSDYRLITNNKIFSGCVNIAGIFVSIEKFSTGIVSFLVCFSLYLLMTKTETGKVLQAVSENKEVAALMGINSDKMFSLAWGISGACVGIAGAALSNHFYIYPTVGAAFTITVIVAVALGGFGSVSGAILGGIVIGLVQTLTGLIFDTVYKMVAVFIVYFLVLMIKPQGLFGKLL